MFNNLNFDTEGKDKSKIDVISNPHSLYSNCGTNLVPYIQANVKTKPEFVSKLHDVANDCSFADKDEIVNFLFLIHNTKERVKDQWIEKMRTMNTITNIFHLAKAVESTVQMETLSKQLLKNTGKLNTTTEVHAVQKHHLSKKTFPIKF